MAPASYWDYKELPVAHWEMPGRVVTSEMALEAPATPLRAGTLKTQTKGAAKRGNTPSLGTKQRLGYGGLVVGKWKIEIAGERDLQEEQFHRSGKAVLGCCSELCIPRFGIFG